MRITPGMMTGTMVMNLARSLGRIEKLHEQLATGRRLNRPSDDAVGVGRALNYHASIAAGEQYIRTMDGALSWLEGTEATLDSAAEILQRARELAVQGGNDVLDLQQQQAIASEVNQILEQMVLLGNASLRGQRLFAGLEIDANPFTLNPGPPTTVTYTGDTGQMLREIDVNATISINVAGNVAFTSTFNALIGLRDNLQNGNTAAVRSTDLAALDGAMDDLLGVRAEVGAKTNRLEAARDRQTLLQVRLQELLSKVEDADFAEVTSKFAVQETVYKAALQSGSKAIQPSLFDYLR